MQSRHITQRLMSTVWFFTSMHEALHSASQRRHPMQSDVSICMRIIGLRLASDSVAPTGHTVLQNVRPPLNASAPMVTNVMPPTAMPMADGATMAPTIRTNAL